MAGELILLIEDDEKTSKLARMILEARGYRVRDAYTAHEGLDTAVSEPPALILLDIGLPDVDGIELLDRLRALPAIAHIPIIAFTAIAMEGDEERMRRAGFDDYISKPIDTRAFVDQ